MTSTQALESDDRVVIALDFGTTFSGVAYAFNIPGTKADVISITDWPGLEGFSQPKVPTLIHYYDPKDLTKFKWGGQVKWSDPAVHGDQPKPIYLPHGNIKSDVKKLPKDPVDVIADFIGAMYKHAIGKIQTATVGDYFDLCQKQFVLSVPAVWSDKAKDLTLKAAKKAGIHPVTLIKEPEAAALFTFCNSQHALKNGDAFVVCDAGGGTVDLITYEVTRMTPYLELAELVPGSGGMAGSLGLNKRFEQAVQEAVGEDQWYLLKKSRGWAQAAEQFDKNIKTSFTGDVAESHYVSFPMANLEDDPVEKISSNCWEMTGFELQNIFDPLIADILRLVEDQVKSASLKRPGKSLKGIFLVGGFGSSRYLLRRIEDGCNGLGIKVIQPTDAWAAIVNRISNNATVVSTQSVRHYGVKAMEEYDPIVDKGRPTVYNDSNDGKIRTFKCTWYIYKGEELKRDQTIKFPFFRSLDADYKQNDLIFYSWLDYSDARVAPTYPGPDVKGLCTVRSDLRGLRRNQLKKRTGFDGKTMYDVHYLLVINTANANIKFSLEFEGKEMGSVEANYN